MSGTETGDQWKLRVDVKQVLHRIGFSPKSTRANGARWDGCCPLHPDEKASFSIAVDLIQDSDGTSMPGHWHCFTQCGSGDIAQLWAQNRGISNEKAFLELLEEYAPDLLKKKQTKAAREHKKQDAIPSAEWVASAHKMLFGHEEAINYIYGTRCITEDVIRKAFLGYDNGFIQFPITDKMGKVVNVRKKTFQEKHSHLPKMMGLTGRGSQPYPLHMVRLAEPLVIVEGEIDALTLHGIGVNAITWTAGISSLSWKNWKPFLKGKQMVILAVDSDPVSRKPARMFAKECLKEGMETVLIVQFPEGIKDVNELFQKTPRASWKEAWDACVKNSSVHSGDTGTAFGIMEDGGCLYLEGAEDPISYFTGRITTSGRIRHLDGLNEGVVTRISLRHRSGKTLMVEHKAGETFCSAVRRASGGSGEWGFMEKDSDRIRQWIAVNSNDHEQKDLGWIFGFDHNETEAKFYTNSTVFTPLGAVENKEMRMSPPNSSLGHFDLPTPNDKEAIKRAGTLLFEQYLNSHDDKVTFPLVASALFAPIRAHRLQSEPLFCVYLYGGTGTGKTMAAWGAQSLFGLFKSQADLANFNGTTKALETLISHAGHSFFVVDEFPIAQASRNKRLELIGLLKGMQTSGRSRLRRDGTLQPAPTARGIACVTSEALPLDDQAQLARSLMVEITRGPTRKERDHFHAVQKDSHWMPYAMSSWIDWSLRSDRDERWENAVAVVREPVEEIFEIVDSGWRKLVNAERFYSRFCSLTAAWRMGLDWAIATEIITPKQASSLLDRWLDVIHRLIESGFQKSSGAGPSELFIESLVSAILSGQARVLDSKGNTTFPKHANSNAPIVGYLIDAKTGKGAKMPSGRNVTVGLVASAANFYKSGDAGSWQTIIPYLRNSGHLNTQDRRLSQGGGKRMRLQVATKDLADELVGPLTQPLGHLSALNSAKNND